MVVMLLVFALFALGAWLRKKVRRWRRAKGKGRDANVRDSRWFAVITGRSRGPEADPLLPQQHDAEPSRASQ
jgi:hypothetical protein